MYIILGKRKYNPHHSQSAIKKAQAKNINTTKTTVQKDQEVEKRQEPHPQKRKSLLNFPIFH